ncbi:MAG: TIGR04282 family arsenosugar biosynthesis glycosyltransferase [Saprospiraceae bacterium]
MNTDSALIIFIKNPIRSQVKTRLAKSIGDAEALNVYIELLKITQTLASGFVGKKYLYYSDFIDLNDTWNSLEYNKRLQEGNNLGERMSKAMQAILKEHQKALIIGSDCPYLRMETFFSAYQLLESQDCVIGPAKDGGYYLLGLREWLPSLFENKTWSSSNLLKETLLTLNQLGKRFKMLEELEDIDTQEEWNRFQEFQNNQKLD